MERTDEEHMAKKVTLSDVEGNRWRGRPRLGWMDGVKRVLGEKGMSVEQGKINALTLFCLSDVKNVSRDCHPYAQVTSKTSLGKKLF